MDVKICLCVFRKGCRCFSGLGVCGLMLKFVCVVVKDLVASKVCGCVGGC